MPCQVHEYSGFPSREVKVSVQEIVYLKTPLILFYFPLINATASSTCSLLLYSFKEMPSDISVQRAHCWSVGSWVAGCLLGKGN